MIKRTIRIPLYDCKINVVFADDINPIAKKLMTRLGIPFYEDDAAYAMFLHTQNVHEYWLLFSLPYLTINRFVHEITHAGLKILMHRGHVNFDNDEPIAYLQGYIAEEIERIMDKNKISFIKPKQNKSWKSHIGNSGPSSPPLPQ